MLELNKIVSKITRPHWKSNCHLSTKIPVCRSLVIGPRVVWAVITPISNHYKTTTLVNMLELLVRMVFIILSPKFIFFMHNRDKLTKSL